MCNHIQKALRLYESEATEGLEILCNTQVGKRHHWDSNSDCPFPSPPSHRSDHRPRPHLHWDAYHAQCWETPGRPVHCSCTCVRVSAHGPKDAVSGTLEAQDSPRNGTSKHREPNAEARGSK